MILWSNAPRPRTDLAVFINTAHRAIAALRLSFALSLLAIVAAAQSYTVTTIAGGQMPATAAYNGSLIVIPSLSGLAADSVGNIYFSSGNQFLGGSNVVFKLDSAGTLTRVAGNGIAGFSGDGGRATAAELNGPGSLAVDNAGNLYILDANNIRVRQVAPNGLISTVAGNGVPVGNPFSYNSGDGGLAIKAQLFGATGVSVDGRGNLYINTIGGVRKVTDGLISTIHAGLPGSWFCTDSAGNLYYISGLSNLVKESPGGAILVSVSIGVPAPAVGLTADGSGNASAGCVAFGQTTWKFEVASVKPAATGQRAPTTTIDPGMVSFGNTNLKNLLMRGYELRSYQVQEPGWMDTERYDVVAKLPEGAPPGRMPAMLQDLLTSRFQLVTHWETRQEDAFVLTVGKNGPKLTKSQRDITGLQLAPDVGYSRDAVGGHGQRASQ